MKRDWSVPRRYPHIRVQIPVLPPPRGVRIRFIAPLLPSSGHARAHRKRTFRTCSSASIYGGRSSGGVPLASPASNGGGENQGKVSIKLPTPAIASVQNIPNLRTRNPLIAVPAGIMAKLPASSVTRYRPSNSSRTLRCTPECQVVFPIESRVPTSTVSAMAAYRGALGLEQQSQVRLCPKSSGAIPRGCVQCGAYLEGWLLKQSLRYWPPPEAKIPWRPGKVGPLHKTR